MRPQHRITPESVPAMQQNLSISCCLFVCSFIKGLQLLEVPSPPSAGEEALGRAAPAALRLPEQPHPLLLAHLRMLRPSSHFPEQIQEPSWAGLRPLLARTAQTPLPTTLQNLHWGARSHECLRRTGQLETCHCP